MKHINLSNLRGMNLTEKNIQGACSKGKNASKAETIKSISDCPNNQIDQTQPKIKTYFHFSMYVTFKIKANFHFPPLLFHVKYF